MHVYYWVPRLTFVRVEFRRGVGNLWPLLAPALSAAAPTHGVTPGGVTLSLVLSRRRG